MFFKSKIKNNCFSKFKAGLPGSAFRNRKTTTGFSMVELIVSIGIFTIITSVVMFNYGRFESNMVVTNLAYEAALAVRQAQVYGISVKKTKSGIGTGFDAPYGVYFDSNLKQSFTLFADRNNNKIPESNTLENEEVFGMNGSNQIRNFCVTSSSGTRICSDEGGGPEALSIMFTRPEPNAKIYTFTDNAGANPSLPYSKAEVFLTSGRGDKVAKMTVTSTGQISVGKE